MMDWGGETTYYALMISIADFTVLAGDGGVMAAYRADCTGNDCCRVVPRRGTYEIPLAKRRAGQRLPDAWIRFRFLSFATFAHP